MGDVLVFVPGYTSIWWECCHIPFIETAKRILKTTDQTIYLFLFEAPFDHLGKQQKLSFGTVNVTYKVERGDCWTWDGPYNPRKPYFAPISGATNCFTAAGDLILSIEANYLLPNAPGHNDSNSADTSDGDSKNGSVENSFEAVEWESIVSANTGCELNLWMIEKGGEVIREKQTALVGFLYQIALMPKEISQIIAKYSVVRLAERVVGIQKTLPSRWAPPIEPDEVATVMTQCSVSKHIARRALLRKGNIVDAILELSP